MSDVKQTEVQQRQQAQTEAKQLLTVHRVYAKAIGLETIQMNLEMPSDQKKMNLEMQVHVASNAREKDLHEAVLSLTLTSKHDTNLLWRLQLQQAGLFTIRGFEKEQLDNILNVFCMNVIYPYACSMIYQVILQAGFQLNHLVPMNFEAFYQERQKQAKEGKGTEKQSVQDDTTIN